MFSLIITIISIALVAALALATLYYGGSAFNKGADGATAAKLINEGQQVNGAATVYRADRASGAEIRADVAALVTGNYLAQVPGSFDGTDLIATDGSSTTMQATKDLTGGECTEVNKRAGLIADPFVAVDTTSGIYGCIQPTAGAVGQFFFKI